MIFRKCSESNQNSWLFIFQQMFVKNKPDDNVVFYLRVASYIRMAKKSIPPHIQAKEKLVNKVKNNTSSRSQPLLSWIVFLMAAIIDRSEGADFCW